MAGFKNPIGDPPESDVTCGRQNDMITCYVRRHASSWMKNQKQSKLKLNWDYSNPNFTDCLVRVKTLLQCSQVSKLKVSGKSNNCGHLHYSCKNTGESFPDRYAVKRMLNWFRTFFRQELLSRAPDVEILQGLVCTAAGLRFLSPALKLHHQRTHFKANHWERVTSSVVVRSKAARCRTQLPGRRCLPLWIWCASSREYGWRAP